MNQVIRFKWPPHYAFLFPNRPLVLAGDEDLKYATDRLLAGYSVAATARAIATRNAVTPEGVAGIVERIATSIRHALSDSSIDRSPGTDRGLAMATVNITGCCNLRCRHCYLGNRRNIKTTEMSCDDLTSLIEQLSNLMTNQPRLLIFSGGEPLLRWDKLKSAIHQGRRLGFNLRLNTNGALLTEEMARHLSENQVLVQVSLDGSTPATHALLRRSEESFHDAKRALTMLVAAGCQSRISATIHDRNCLQIPEMISLAESLGVQQFTTSSLVNIGDAKSNNLQPVPFATEFEVLFNAVRSDKARQRMVRSTLLAETSNAIRNGIRFVYCGTGCSTLCVDADGTLYPCINLVDPGYSAGDTLSTPVATIWGTSPILKVLRGLSVQTMNDRCRDCIFRHFCGGYCRGETLANGHSILAPYSRCSDWKRGLVAIFRFLAMEPELFDFTDTPANNSLHHE